VFIGRKKIFSRDRIQLSISQFRRNQKQNLSCKAFSSRKIVKKCRNDIKSKPKKSEISLHNKIKALRLFK
jgi:hypothetical protein